MSGTRNGHGVRFAAHSPLLAEALTLLHERPRSTRALARRVLGLRGGGAPGLAERILTELFRGTDGVGRDERGRWRIAPPPPGPAARPLREIEYAVVDVETTGGSALRGGRIVEIAVFGVRDGVVVDEFATLVDPGVAIPAWVSRLTGISDRLVDGAPRFRDIADRVRSSLEGRVFVAHNAAFDWRFVSEEVRRAASVLPSGPRLCTVRLARRALPGLPRRGLDAVADYYGVEIRERHRARGDALATAALLPRLLTEAERAGVRRWGELEAWVSRGDLPGPASGADAPC